MKKLLFAVLAVFIMTSLFAGGRRDNKQSEATTAAEPAAVTEPVTIRLGGLKGPTSMGMVKLLDDAENGLTVNKYDFTMAGSADELTPRFLKGELDILAVPANLGAVLYNNSNGAVKMIAINTLGVIYICEKNGNTINSLTDLKGKTIYATGKGSTPEYALRYLLAEKGLDMDKDVTLEWKSEPTEVVALIASKDNAVAMLPQPFVTVAGNQLADLRVAIDLTKEWDALDNGSQFITAGLIARKEFLENNPQAAAEFLKEYAASTAYANEHVPEAAVLVEKYNIVKAPIAQKAIPFCNIVCITGKDMISSVSGYLEVLYNQKPAATGGKLPAADFYWSYE